MISFLYAFMAGNLLGSGVGGHALRLVTVTKEDGWIGNQQSNRIAVAVGAIVIYSFAALAAAVQDPVSLCIAIGGPILGVTAVTLSGSKVDSFQRVLGVFQLVPMLTAFTILFLKFSHNL